MRLLAIAVMALISSAALAQSDDRAWLAPGLMEFVGGKVIVRFGNVGRSPAIGFVAQEESGIIKSPKAESLYSVFPKTLLTDVCARTKATTDGGGVIYQSVARDHQYQVPISIKPLGADGLFAVYVHGCFAYLSGGVEHKAEYCFLLWRDGKRVARSQCPYGNNAT